MNDIVADRADFEKFIQEIGVNAHQLRSAELTATCIPKAQKYFQVGNSKIDRLGMIAVECLFSGTDIIARVGQNWTTMGRFVNHSKTPNFKAYQFGYDVHFLLQHDLVTGEEATIDYRQLKAVLDKSDSTQEVRP